MRKTAVKKVTKDAPQSDDTLLVGAVSDDGKRALVLRKKGEELSVGELGPLEEGKPITGEVVSLSQREEHPALFDVKTEYAPKQRDGVGPARVSNQSYRDGWDTLWGRRKRQRQAN